MKRKILSILALCLVQTSTNASEPQDLVTSAAMTNCTPATIEGLESFVRPRIDGGLFPEVGFSLFKAPFLTKKYPSRLEEAKAKNAAISVLGQIVALVFCAFNKEQADRKQPIHFAGVEVGRAAARESTKRYYQENNHRYFLIFQEMCTQVLTWAATRETTRKEASRILTSNYGISSDFGIVWVRDNVGIVPMPYHHGTLGRTIYQACAPYGYWGDYYQRSIMVVDGRLIESAGLYIDSADGDFYKFVRESGVPGKFITSPITIRAHRSNEVLVFLNSAAVFRATLDGGCDAFIPLPSTPDEQKEFEAVLWRSCDLILLQADLRRLFLPGGFCRHMRGR